MTTYRYTMIAVRDLPYPKGLGKAEYPELESSMKRLLSQRWNDQAANERMFWTPTYQDLIRTHLEPKFARCGDIVSIATLAAANARTSQAFDRDITGTYQDAHVEYRRGIAPLDDLMAAHGPITAWWIIDPPSLYWDEQTWRIANGRHRLSYLRSIVQPREPEFPVFVETSR